MDYTMNEHLWPIMGNRHPAWAPQGCYRCLGEDMWVAITVQSDTQWHAFCSVTGHPDWEQDARFIDAVNRHMHQDELDALIEGWTTERDHREVTESLQAAGVPAGAVLKARELLEDPHFAARGYFPEVGHTEAGNFPVVGVYAKFSKTPGHLERSAPLLGEHNEYVFHSLLGLSSDETDKLMSEGIISYDPATPQSVL